MPVPAKMFVTCDSVALRFEPGPGLQILLIERANEPYQGSWCLPGGFVELDEDLPDACARELEEESALQPAELVQIGAFGTPGRDPRGRNVTVAFLALIAPGAVAAAGDDAAGARWHPAGQLPPLGFDHADIVAAGLSRLRMLAERTAMPLALLGPQPEAAQLRDLLGALRGREVSDHEVSVWLASVHSG